jgi:hypothetical protein
VADTEPRRRRRRLGGTTRITGEGSFDSALGAVGWVTFRIPGNGFVGGVRCLTTSRDTVWTVTYWTRSTADRHTLGDQMVASLTPGPAGA